MTDTSVRRIFLLLFVTALFAGCDVLGIGDSGPRDRLNNARDRWNDHHLSNYTFTYRGLCFCIQDATDSVNVVVQADTISSVTYVATGQPVRAEFRDIFRTVPQLFALIDSAYARHAAKVDVVYDPTYGFPASADIDYSLQIADEEYGFRVTKLRLTGGN